MTDNKPNTAKSSAAQQPFNISIGGNVGPGSVVGQGSIVADIIAGRDVSLTRGDVEGMSSEDFQGMLDQLQKLIELAQKEGELDKTVAKQALDDVKAAAELAKESPPPKRRVLHKLEDVSEILDGASDTIEAAGGVARVLTRTMPFAALLIKLASYLF